MESDYAERYKQKKKYWGRDKRRHCIHKTKIKVYLK